jgi:hypothetical protein
MPTFARSRFSAELAACQSNLTSVGQSVNMYMNDNGQQLPSSLTLLTQVTGGQAGYLGQVPKCPSDGSPYSYDPISVDHTAFTVWCIGIHNKCLGSEVPVGFPQYQTSRLVNQ